MRAAVIIPTDDGGRLKIDEVAEPVPTAGELLVEVRATAVNRADLSQRAGRYRQPATANRGDHMIAGLESAGLVVGAGDRVAGHAVGDRIMAMCGGGYAERVVVDHRLAIPVPGSMTWTEAAATPVAFMTEHDALVTHGRFSPGETVLVTAASSAVGLAGVQIAKYLGAGIVIGTVIDNAHVAGVRAAGADVVINSATQDFADAARQATDGRGVDILIDHVGGPELPTSLRALAVGGRLISVGRLGSFIGELDMNLLALNRVTLVGVTFRTRTLEEYADVVRRMRDDLLPGLATGDLRPIVDRVFDLEDAEAAQAHMAANRHFGKIVIQVGDADG